MALSAEWRIYGEFDTVVIVDDEDNTVREALTADAKLLSSLLTTPGALDGWHGDHTITDDKRDPAAWGALVLARSDAGQVLEMDPERFWNGIYLWFRSRGVDYDTPQ